MEDNEEYEPESIEKTAEDSEATEAEDEEFSLDDLGAAYKEAMAEAGLLPELPDDESDVDGESSEVFDGENDEADKPAEPEPVAAPTPEGVVEAALFLGHPENEPLKAKELARVMRDVSPKEVDSIVKELNEAYEEGGHAMRIIRADGGYRMVLSQDLDSVRRVFYGKVREARLSQSALEILSLVAYQPGISVNDLTKQRGRDCGPLLNQLVRRRLLDVTREKLEGQGRAVATYHPTDRFLNLFGLSSLEDLPHVEEDVSAI